MQNENLGHFGVLMVQLELIRQGIHSTIMDPMFYDFDLYLSNDVRVEIKTANIYQGYSTTAGKRYIQYSWTFNNTKHRSAKDRTTIPRLIRDCDAYVFVCLGDDKTVEKYYIIPADDIDHGKKILRINKNTQVGFKSKSKYCKYENNWHLIKYPLLYHPGAMEF